MGLPTFQTMNIELIGKKAKVKGKGGEYDDGVRLKSTTDLTLGRVLGVLSCALLAIPRPNARVTPTRSS